MVMRMTYKELEDILKHDKMIYYMALSTPILVKRGVKKNKQWKQEKMKDIDCLLYTSPSPRD